MSAQAVIDLADANKADALILMINALLPKTRDLTYTPTILISSITATS
jgi:transposase